MRSQKTRKMKVIILPSKVLMAKMKLKMIFNRNKKNLKSQKTNQIRKMTKLQMRKKKLHRRMKTKIKAEKKPKMRSCLKVRMTKMRLKMTKKMSMIMKTLIRRSKRTIKCKSPHRNKAHLKNHSH